jgi:hypothetical protein
MRGQPQGNGSGKINIIQADMGGWIRVFTERLEAAPEDLAVYLSQTVAEWFRERPHLRLLTVVPIAKHGDTVELHAWYDQHVFPAIQGPQPS